MPNIKLQSSDGEVFEVDVEIAKCSVTIKTMLEDLGMDEDEEEVVPLPNVNSAILKKVIQWATYHKDDPPPPEDDENKEKRTDDISSWDADFLKVDQGTLFELILAANYLDIKGLLDVTCKTVANMIKGKTPEEIRKTFNIKNDFTASEEEQVRKENEWCEEKWMVPLLKWKLTNFMVQNASWVILSFGCLKDITENGEVKKKLFFFILIVVCVFAKSEEALIMVRSTVFIYIYMLVDFKINYCKH